LLPVGAKAPDFAFVRLADAQQSKLSELAGRIVIVEFWASWC
jgi:thiol-disulfide isomerase/thioredoxin